MAYSIEEIDEMFERIIKGIAEDGESLRSVLNRHSMPSRKTFFQWLEQTDEDGNITDEAKEKRNQYARACEERADNIFEEILEIADDSSGDLTYTEQGKEVINSEFVQRSRLKVDARKWMVGKMNPKKYGEKNTTVLEGGETPVQVTTIAFKSYKED